jgi:Glycosyltransferase family 28 C-terminal domain
VMVPLPHATADHQAANARAVAAAGGAVVIDDAALDGPALAAAVAPLLADPERLAAMAAAMRSQAHPDAAEELAALVVEASGRRTREDFLADVAAAAAPVDREATGWFESAGAPAGGPTVQRRVDRRTKRMEAYPPIDRNARRSAQDQGEASAPVDARDADPATGDAPPGVQEPRPPAAGDASSNGRPASRPNAGGGPPTDQDAGP